VKFDLKLLHISALFSAIITSLRNITTVPWTCQHTNYIPLFTVTFTSNSRYTAICAVSKLKLCELVYCNIYCYNNYQYCCLQLHIVLFIYTPTLHHYVTIHFKYSRFHGNVFLCLYLYMFRSPILSPLSLIAIYTPSFQVLLRRPCFFLPSGFQLNIIFGNPVRSILSTCPYWRQWNMEDGRRRQTF
jgi:hypothetical protein